MKKMKQPVTTDSTGAIKQSKPIPKLVSITAAELQKLDIPPIEYLVDKILPIGLSMLGAPSKYFKSYMALGLCVCICKGIKFLGYDTKKCSCLYLDLESTKRRPKSRINQILKGEGAPDNLHILTGTDKVTTIGNGFKEQMEQFIVEHPEIRLIVIDVFQKVRGAAKRNQTGYDRDYDDFGVVKELADQYNIGILLIHHTRKMKDPSDVFNELSGSVGVMGALDAAWVISKDDRYSDEATLHITGRDMESIKLKIRFNRKTFQWEFIGTEEDIEVQRLQAAYDQSPVIATIKKLIQQNNGRWEGSAGDIIKASQFFPGCKIYDDSSMVGKTINRFEPMLYGIEDISIEYDTRTRGKRKYIFTVVSVASVDSDVAVTSVVGNSIQQKLSFEEVEDTQQSNG